MLARPLGSIRGSSSPSPRICGQLVEGQLDFEDVLARRIAGLAGSVLTVAGAADRRADVARTLADAARAFRAVAELGEVDLRHRDRDQLAPGLADHLAVSDVLPQVGLDLAADDLLEAVRIVFDFAHHGRGPRRRKHRTGTDPTTPRNRTAPGAATRARARAAVSDSNSKIGGKKPNGVESGRGTDVRQPTGLDQQMIYRHRPGVQCVLDQEPLRTRAIPPARPARASRYRSRT